MSGAVSMFLSLFLAEEEASLGAGGGLPTGDNTSAES